MQRNGGGLYLDTAHFESRWLVYYEKVRKVKALYDPDNFFKCNRNVPPAEDRFDAHDEGRPIQVEEYRAVDGLNRSKKHILDRGVKVPDWLNEAIKVLAMDDRQLIRAKKRAMQKGERVDRIPAEYVIRTSHFFERYTDVEPDHVVKTSKDLERLIYKVY